MSLFGMKTIIREIKKGEFYCPTCETIQTFSHSNEQKFIEINSSPAFPISRPKNFAKCTHCHTHFDPDELEEDNGDTENENFEKDQYKTFLETIVFCMSKVALADEELHTSELTEIITVFETLTGKELKLEQVLDLLRTIEKEDNSVKQYLAKRLGYLTYEARVTIVRSVLRISQSDGFIDSTEADLIKEIVDGISISEKDLHDIYKSEGL